MMDDNDQSYLAANKNVGTLDAQEWYPESWELDKMNILF